MWVPAKILAKHRQLGVEQFLDIIGAIIRRIAGDQRMAF
jgi:hypothetical protein